MKMPVVPVHGKIFFVPLWGEGGGGGGGGGGVSTL